MLAIAVKRNLLESGGSLFDVVVEHRGRTYDATIVKGGTLSYVVGMSRLDDRTDAVTCAVSPKLRGRVGDCALDAVTL